MDYNTRLVLIGSGILGAVCGLVGVYLLLRKRSLIGDAICHASLPGIAIAFILSVALGGTGRNLFVLLGGATVSGILGSLTVLGMRRWTNLKEDAVLAIVLSVYFGLGMALMSLVQQMPEGNAAGLDGFIYGNAAAIVASDAWMILIAASTVAAILILLGKEFTLLCFDAAHAASQGWPVLIIDLLLLACVLAVVIIGTSIVGVLLIIALLVIPPSASRFWSDSLNWNLIGSSAIGAVSGILGSLSSYFIDSVPSGAAIVLVASTIFAISMILGRRRGLLWRVLHLQSQRMQADEEHVLRAIYELLESRQRAPSMHGAVRSDALKLDELIRMRQWTAHRLRSTVRHLARQGWVRFSENGEVALTAAGIQHSRRAIRRHRLLELYFARWADLSPEAIDRCADYTEHSLDDDLLAMLEHDAISTGVAIELPASIHPIGNN